MMSIFESSPKIPLVRKVSSIRHFCTQFLTRKSLCRVVQKHQSQQNVASKLKPYLENPHHFEYEHFAELRSWNAFRKTKTLQSEHVQHQWKSQFLDSKPLVTLFDTGALRESNLICSPSVDCPSCLNKFIDAFKEVFLKHPLFTFGTAVTA